MRRSHTYQADCKPCVLERDAGYFDVLDVAGPGLRDNPRAEPTGHGGRDGKPVTRRIEKWRALGLCATMSKRKAVRERDKIMREVNGQIYTIQSHIPFKEFVEVFRREHYRGLKETSKRYYDQPMNAWIMPTLGNKKLYQIGPLEISEMLSAMENTGVARTTRVATRAILSTMFEKARKWGYLKDASNPAQDAEIGRGNKGGRTIWTPTIDEARAIVGHADDDVALIVEFIVWTGMRISEVLGLRCRNVDPDQAVVYIRERRSRWDVGDPKSDAGQRPLPVGYLAERLRPLMVGPEDFLLRQADGEPWTDQLLYRRIRSAMDGANLYHTGNAWHAFRRLHSTLMSKRMSLFDLRAQMGHANIKTTQKYVATPVDTRAEALAAAQANVIPFKKAKTA
jgi:integrase